MDSETRNIIDEQWSAFEAFKATNDANARKRDVLLEQQLARINAALDKSTDRLDLIETAMNRAPRGDGQPQSTKSFEDWCRGAVKSLIMPGCALPPAEQQALEKATTEAKALTIGDDSTGGFLAPPQFAREILKGVVEISPMRSVVRVMQTSARALEIPKRTQTGGAAWTAESETRTETQQPKFGMETIPNHEMYALIDVSAQNLEDSAFNLEEVVRMEAVEQFSETEGTAFITGNAVGKPEGLLTNSSVETTASGSATTIADSDGQADGIISLFHALKTSYSRNGVFLLNRTTLGSVRKLKDEQNNYIWTPLAMGAAPAILGAPYVEMPDMPNEGAGNKPIAFGDFRRGYIISDRINMSMLRDPFTQASSGNVRFWFRRRVGGQVVISEAVRLLVCSAS